MALMENFITTMENVKSHIDHTIALGTAVTVKRDRRFLSSVIRALEHCGHKGDCLKVT